MNLPIKAPSSDYGMRTASFPAADHAVENETPSSTVEWIDPRQILRTIHSALRGRYRLAIVLSVICAIAGIVAGYQFTTLSYQSQGLIRIASSLPPVLQETDQSRPMAMYDAFMDAQQMILTSRRVLETAALDPAWQHAGGERPSKAMNHLTSGLKIAHLPNTEHITITFIDPNPATAAAAVNAIIHSYADFYTRKDKASQQQRISVLTSHQKELLQQQEALNRKIQAIAAEFGSTSVDGIYAAALDRVNKLEAQLSDIRLALAMGQQPALARQDSLMGAEQIAMVDPWMRDEITERTRIVQGIDRMKARGYLDSHPDMVAAEKMLRTTNERIEKYATQYQHSHAGNLAMMADARSGSTARTLMDLPVDVLRANESAVLTLYEQSRREMVALGGKKLELDRLKGEMTGIQSELSQVTGRLDVLTVESILGDRLEIVTGGEVPTTPLKDNRNRNAIAGGLGGGLLPILLLALMGWMHPRYRYSDETEDDASIHPTLLGILPMLPDHMGDPEKAANAAQCVHQIRVMLQVGYSNKTRVFLVTSASPGEGKTSLAAALALSFAASGSRTLLMDCDMVGQRLTWGFKAQKLPGLHEAIRDGHIDPYITSTASPGLSLMPVGQGDALHACTLSSQALSKTLAEARAKFDVVIIDSGPILGSVEAAVAAPQADNVILTIARNQQRPAVQRSLRYLGMIGARVAGVVFNRAESKDFSRSIFGSSMRSISPQQAAAHMLVRQSPETAAFGPLVESVASFLPSAN